METHPKIQRRWWLVLGLLSVFFYLLIEVHTKKTLGLDQWGSHWLVQTWRNSTLTLFFKGMTFLGSILFLVSAGVGSLLLLRHSIFRFLIPLNQIFGTVLYTCIKYIIQRPRPTGFRLIAERGFSFPSGHSLSSMVFYGFLIFLVQYKIKNPTQKHILSVLLGGIILMIGMSRIYLGVHYTSDVLAGFSLGLAYLIVFCTFVEQKYFKRYKKLKFFKVGKAL